MFPYLLMKMAEISFPKTTPVAVASYDYIPPGPHKSSRRPELFDHAIVPDGLADERVGAWHAHQMLGGGQEVSPRRETDCWVSPD
jgi:hypothetical protein